MVRVTAKSKDWPINRAIPSLPYLDGGELKWHPPFLIGREKAVDGVITATYSLNEDQISYLSQQEGISVEVLDG